MFRKSGKRNVDAIKFDFFQIPALHFAEKKEYTRCDNSHGVVRQCRSVQGQRNGIFYKRPIGKVLL